MHPFLKETLKHTIIFSLLVIGMLVTIFIMSLSNTLHPDAYRDGFMSIVYVYIIIILVHLLLVLLKRATFLKLDQLVLRLKTWDQQQGLLVHIAILFTSITVINSVMMITGIDTPKTGSFAYTHLLTRTGIVTLAGVLWKSPYLYQTYIKKRTAKDSRISLVESLGQAPFSFSAVLFTLITVIGCLVMLTLSQWVELTGGVSVYIALVILYAGCLGMVIIFNKSKRQRLASS